jgi:hypothetical protein
MARCTALARSCHVIANRRRWAAQATETTWCAARGAAAAPLPSEPPEDILVPYEDGVNPDGENLHAPRPVIAGPPGDRRNVDAVARWADRICVRVARQWARIDERLGERGLRLAPHDRVVAARHRAHARAVIAKCADVPTTLRGLATAEQRSIWAEHAHAWATRAARSAKRVTKWIEQRKPQPEHENIARGTLGPRRAASPRSRARVGGAPFALLPPPESESNKRKSDA